MLKSLMVRIEILIMGKMVKIIIKFHVFYINFEILLIMRFLIIRPLE